MDLSDVTLQNFKPGVYLHYKGKLYEADHLMRDANDESRIGVHYIGQELDGAKDGPRHLIRTWSDWRAMVHEDGSVCTSVQEGTCEDGRLVAERFRYLGPFYVHSMSTDSVQWS